MKSISEYSDIVNKAIARVVYPEPNSLYDPIKYTMEGNGKRLRPVLVLAVADALDADINDALNPALGIEFYHNFTLLHDDVMDNSPKRRGREAVWKKWDVAQAILSGDTMLSMASDFILNSRYDAETRLALVENFNRTAVAVDHGQQYDMDFEHRDNVSLSEYLDMISLKTGKLIAGACVQGAICAGAETEVRDAFYDYGLNLGIAFQIQDDILDVYGNEATLGKPIGGDILNDKHTWLHILAMEEAPKEMSEAATLKGVEKIDAVRSIYDKLQLQQRGESQVAHYLDIAIDSINKIRLPQEATEFFVNFAHSLIGRKK